MLSRLLKHELKATSRMLVPLYLILFCITILDRIMLYFLTDSIIMKVVSSILTLGFITINIAILIVTTVLMVTRFYKNLMTDEGYLMFTLPVKVNQLITSKLIIAIFWTVISFAALFVSTYIAFATPERMDFVLQNIRESFSELQNAFGGSVVILTIEMILLIITCFIANILMFYVSIAIGQLFNGRKLVGSFIAYIGIYTAIQIILLIIVGFSALINLADPYSEGSLVILLPVMVLLLAISCVVFYGATNHILSKRLNLE
ncbi:hypothetical protein QA584_13350 [Anaerocolumna sp. AGMB13025]|uniref:hypothetical protein n=1 Tax=Anaerocolumna sp. AGMB13025 TaxID=3039116 RepID=UPI00241BF7D9|nr:hypothetical protein [Anaerocolumna sp. AGMB13025]WFR60021.1 hypothetical protein QA584_13350 [Anaerocolumna sp. AGMB13025]